ncbi:proteobacterial sortase system OmpA family protein [Helicobacter pylori Hp H-34]|uniref:Proteobacterial sortase system OmpA family protein n=1 Tax=Helicobacter pylori Hp H-34 TaxID=992069 RepID=J0ECA9_HELPX|nr:proteobacterial sortase system OmpA family protein [Helicobacter pylori Hp H-34]
MELKKVDADILSEETNEYIKYINEGNDLLEKAEEVIKAVASDCEFALARFEEKKCYIRNEVISEFSHHFNQLKGFELSNKKDSMEDIQLYVSDTLKIIDKNLKMSSFDTFGVVGNAVGGFSVGFGMVGGMAVVGGLLAAPSLAIFGALSADDMEEKLENAKAYYSQVEAAVKKADAMIDNIQAVRKVVDLFTEQITKLDALFFSLSQGTIATMKKHNYDTSRYNQKEKDQLCVTVSTLMTLSAFLKVPIMDEHQKLNEKAQKALNLMRDQMDSLENGDYSLDSIRYRQAQLKDLRDDKNS